MPIERKTLSLNDITVLGLVAESNDPINGKTLEKMIESRGMRVWTKIGKSSVYHALKKLEQAKLLRSEKRTIERKGAAPPVTKIFYEITPEGKKQLQQAIIHTIRTPAKLIDPFEIAFSNTPLLSKSELIEVLEDRLKAMEPRQQFLSERVNYYKRPDATGVSVEGLPTRENLHIVQALFSRPLAFLRCEKKWIKSYLKELKTEK